MVMQMVKWNGDEEWKNACKESDGEVGIIKSHRYDGMYTGKERSDGDARGNWIVR